MLQPFTAPNDRSEWQSYQPLTTPLPLQRVPKEALARLATLAEAAPASPPPSPRSAAPSPWPRMPGVPPPATAAAAGRPARRR
ncbi:hypothetical protein ACFQY5_07280 [Paeniroseomonas aquatica]|uniref:hypothetical protein n=1 Tax=Paeniroseomonas aquatica TaxID=373043 RepID=UPI00360E4CA3